MGVLPLGMLASMTAGCGPGDQSDSGSASVPEQRKLTDFGLQLSTITPLLMADFEGTLAQVAAMGYRQVEFSALGFLGRPAPLVADLLAANELVAPVGRISPKLPEGFGAMSSQDQRKAFRTYAGPDYLLDNIRYGLQAVEALGQKHLVLPALMPDAFTTGAKVRKSIDLLRQAGELCAAAGVQFGYHNHDWEFNPVDGLVPFDLMLESLEPELMSWQLDVYWVTKAGLDPLQYLSANVGRVPSCHLKDISADGDFEDVGHGLIDFPSFVAAAEASGTEYYFVERDNPPEPMRTAERAYAYLQQMVY